MKIGLNFNNQNYNNKKANQRLNLKPLAFDTVSFSSMKKGQFDGIDLMVVNKFKAPIEKFNSNEDFQKWCKDKLNDEYVGNVEALCESEDGQAEFQKEKILNDWINYITVENKAYTPAIQLLILSSITAGLEYRTNHLPSVLDKRILADTMQEITENCKKDKNYNCNFDKLYRGKLYTGIISKESSLDSDTTGWVVIPSEAHDPDNFQDNVKKLQMFSHDSWCTKTYNAEPYLSEGDFHVYLVKGKPQLGVRFEGNKIAEVQGEKNDRTIPSEYLETLLEHISFDDLSQDAMSQMDEETLIKKFINDRFPKGIEQYSAEEIFKSLKIGCKKDENGMLTISEYRQPNEMISFKDIGISENELLKNVVKIDGDADFVDSSITKKLSNLQTIEGDVYLSSLYEFPRGNTNVKGKVYLGEYELPKDMADCIQGARNVFKRTIPSEDLYLLIEEHLSEKQAKVCRRYLEEGMDIEEAVYEAGFTPRN